MAPKERFEVMVVVVILLVLGIIAPRLPFNKHTGLRLPWTVQDEEAWNVAHRIIGYISIPVVLLYLICCFIFGIRDIFAGAAVLTVVLVPGGISFLSYWRKSR